MMTIQELKRWLDTLDPNNSVAVDEGGLALIEVTPEGLRASAAYIEIGGQPDFPEGTVL